MKINLSILFSLMTFFVVTLSIIETHGLSVVHPEMAIESVSELESSEVESTADTADLLVRSVVSGIYCKSLSFSDEDFAYFILTKDIFRPPRIA